MTKLFSLIDRSEIELRPGAKVIPKEAYSSYLDAKELLEKAEGEITAFKEKAHTEAEALKQKAIEQGHKEGLEKWTSALAELEKKVSFIKKEVESEIVSLVLECGKKIVGNELKTSKTTVVKIVKEALKPVSDHESVTIFVSKEDFPTVEKHKATLKKQLEYTTSFSIQPRGDIEPGGCVIETEAGIINAQLDVLWKSLEIALKALVDDSKKTESS